MMEETQGMPNPESIPNDGQPEKEEKITLTSDLIKEELQKEKHKNAYKRVLRSTVGILIAVVAAVVLLVVLVLPVLQISGNSMEGTLKDGDIVVAVSSSRFEQGDVIAFYYGNDILLKRVIACAGQWVDMDAEGNVYVDDELLEEPYVTEKSPGESSITFPYQVPDGKAFVLGDNRSVSVDSRNGNIGCVEGSMAVGKIVLRVWPLSDFGLID